MSSEQIISILKKCIHMLEFTTKDLEVANEYLFWINWVRKEMQNISKIPVNERMIIIELIDSNILLKEDLWNYI